MEETEEIVLEDGKYTFRFSWKTGKFSCLRYGEEWRDLAGDHATLALFSRVKELEEQLEKHENDGDMACKFR